MKAAYWLAPAALWFGGCAPSQAEAPASEPALEAGAAALTAEQAAWCQPQLSNLNQMGVQDGVRPGTAYFGYLLA